VHVDSDADDAVVHTSPKNDPVNEVIEAENEEYFEYTGNKLSPRLAPYNLINWFGTLNATQKKVVTDIGFGPVLNLKLENVPTSLAFWLVENYNHHTNTLNISDRLIHITPEVVHEIMGIPMGQIEIENKRPNVKDPVIAEWRSQYKDTPWIRRPYVIEFFRKLSKKKGSGRNFMLNFLVGFFTVLGETDGNSVVNQRFLPFVKEDINIKDLNWCAYMITCLNRCKAKWKPHTHFNGPVILLAVRILYNYLYINATKCH